MDAASNSGGIADTNRPAPRPRVVVVGGGGLVASLRRECRADRARFDHGKFQPQHDADGRIDEDAAPGRVGFLRYRI